MGLRTLQEIMDDEQEQKRLEELSEDSFTPQFDFLLQYPNGRTLASVYGKIWRYCQMKHGRCEASVERLADELNTSAKTVERAIDWLAGNQLEDEDHKEYHGRYGNGLVIDTTPHYKRSRPHIYKVNMDEHLRQTMAFNQYRRQERPKIGILG